ncbi:hypothetical protein [Actinoplanes sp. NBRC 101535]
MWVVTEIVAGTGGYQIQNVSSGRCLDMSTDGYLHLIRHRLNVGPGTG